jgi:hypothetical protein
MFSVRKNRAMSRPAPLFAAFVFLLTLSPTGLLAQCVDQPRNVTLDKDYVVPLKSYLCSAGSGADAAKFRVEYYRLTDIAVSLLLANAASAKMKKTLGSARLVANDVSRTYTDLLKQFGTTKETTDAVSAFELAPPGPAPADDSSDGGSDKVDLKKLRTLLGFGPPQHTNYPANDEIASLRKKIIPANLSYYYSILESLPTDDPSCEKSNIVCAKFGRDILTMKFWRYLTVADIDSFAANAKVYNSRLLQVRKDKAAAKYDYITTTIFDASELKLAKFLANGSLPEDFLPMIGEYLEATCGDSDDLAGIAGWGFSIIPRIATVEAVRFENVSQKPISLGGLFGDKKTDASLQAAPFRPAAAAGGAMIDSSVVTIAPGQSVLELTNITFSEDPDAVAEFRKYRQSMDAIHTRVGANGFSGNVGAYQGPEPKNYIYGPAFAVTGAMVNSVRVDFNEMAAPNFVNMTIGYEAGSCPYLYSWNASDREWIDHGKILHKGQGIANSYTETRTFPGLRTHFRIEEHEPEVAHLQRPILFVEFRDGSSQTFEPLAPADNAAGMTLMWGEAVDFSFAVPNTVKADDVVETSLEIAGYYDRYSQLLAQQSPHPQASALPVRLNPVEPGAAEKAYLRAPDTTARP